jgi:hypothetical protein
MEHAIIFRGSRGTEKFNLVNTRLGRKGGIDGCFLMLQFELLQPLELLAELAAFGLLSRN